MVHVDLSLEGKVLQILTVLQPEKQMHFSIQGALCRRFDHIVNTEVLKTSFFGCRQKMGEGLAAYLHDIQLYTRQGSLTFKLSTHH